MSPRRPVAAITLLAVSGVVASCASVQTPGTGSDARLIALAERERPRPVADRAAVPVPPGIPDVLTTLADLDANARTPLADVLREAAERDLDLPAPSTPAQLSPALAVSAARLYTQARAALLADRQTEAATLYEQVVAIDPSASEAWVALATLRGAQGDSLAATQAWRSALANDRTNVRALEQLGLAALRRNDADEALAFLARARLNQPERIDPALPYLLDAALADALERAGYLLAAADAARDAASAPTPFDHATNEQRRMVVLLRQRPLMLRGAGDILLRLNDPQAAANAYLASLDTSETLDALTLARAVYALRLSGADATAAATLVRELERSQGRIEALHLRLVESLSDSLRSDAARALAAALPGVPMRGGWEMTPASSSAAARLAAAAQTTPQAAADVLLRHLGEIPADDAATEQLARTLASSPRTLAQALASLAAQQPLRAAHFTALFARAATDRAAFETALRSLGTSTTPLNGADLTPARGAALASAWLRLRAGDASGALTRFESIGERDALVWPYASIGRVDALLTLGRAREAVDVADALADENTPTARLLAGVANSAMQRHAEALALLRPLLADESLAPSIRTEALLYAARSAAAIGDVDNAERSLRTAAILAPLREDAYAGLIQIGFATGAQRNQAQLADVVRRLRENIPTSRTLRLLQARELASQGQHLAAMEILDDVLSLDPRDEAAQEQYVGTLMGAGRQNEAERWLRERLASEAAEPSTLVLLARVLAATSRAEEAEALLRDEGERFAQREMITRERETLLRGPLQKPLDADRLALERLTAAPPTLDNTLEIAEIRARLGDWEASAHDLESTLSRPGVSLRRDQRDRLARTVGLFAASADQLDESTSRLAADVAGHLAEDPSGASEVVHRARVALLVRANAPAGEILDATSLVARSNRDLALQLRLATVEAASGFNLDLALAVARDGATINGEVAVEMLVARALVAAQFARPDEAIGALDVAVARRLTEEFTRALAQAIGANPPSATADELAYYLGMLFEQFGDDAGADTLYERALESNPNHAWAANNLGYRMVERGEHLLRAYDLIQRAYSAEPTEMPIVDSMGWARYRVGIFEDTRDARGHAIEGAVTLLSRAATGANRPDDYVVHDHLGDALWRAGRVQDAARAWRRAADLAEGRLKELSNFDGQLERVAALARDVRAARATILGKAEAAEAGATPVTAAAHSDLREQALRIEPPAVRAPQPPQAPDLNGAGI